MIVEDNYQRWLSASNVDDETKKVLKAMSEEEKSDAFFKDVEFGTAGMRGILGPGTNRMNVFTVNKATVAFARYLLEKYSDAKERGVVISHDNRHMSREFTLSSAKTLNCFGIKVYIFDSLRPTPELSFAVRKSNAVGGIMITASHNPKEYNGYKVYDENGCQLVPEKIERLLEILSELPNELEIEIPKSQKMAQTIVLGKDYDEDYINHVLSISLNPNLNKDGFKVVFTPQHGTSYVNAMEMFKIAGYDGIIPVTSQCSPDPDFSGTLSPNPEDKRAYIEAIKVAKDNNADLIVMTDPDADRVGVAYLSSKGNYELFTGNQSGALLIDYVLSQRKAQGKLSKNGVMFNTIVTSTLGSKIAESYGVKVESLLTGFKFIGDRIAKYENSNGPHFEFGYEESYGCLVAPFARDKDGLQALLLLVEMTLYHLRNGKRLDQVMDDLQKQFGYYNDTQYSIEFKGPLGLSNMQKLMKMLHDSPLKEIAGYKVIRVEDYLKQVSTTIEGKKEEITLPQSDVIKFFLENEATVTVRPSGTEPKCKFYYGTVGKMPEEVADLPKKLHEFILKVIGF